jgi:hypothetical protein
MKYLISFLAGLLLFTLIAAESPQVDKPLSKEILDTRVIECEGGFNIAVVYYEDRAEFYLDDKTAFAVIGKLTDSTIVIYIRTSDGVIHKFSSGEEAEAALGRPCEVAKTFRAKKFGISI